LIHFIDGNVHLTIFTVRQLPCLVYSFKAIILIFSNGNQALSKYVVFCLFVEKHRFIVGLHIVSLNCGESGSPRRGSRGGKIASGSQDLWGL